MVVMAGPREQGALNATEQYAKNDENGRKKKHKKTPKPKNFFSPCMSFWIVFSASY